MKEERQERGRRFNALFNAYGADIVAYCTWRAGSTSDAEEAVADVFLTAWRRLDDVPRGDGARVWLYATARRVLANQRRSMRRRTGAALAVIFRPGRTRGTGRAEAAGNTGQPGEGRASSASVTRLSAAL